MLQTSPYQLLSPTGMILPPSPLDYTNYLTQQFQAQAQLFSSTRIRTDAHNYIKRTVIPAVVTTNKNEVVPCPRNTDGARTAARPERAKRFRSNAKFTKFKIYPAVVSSQVVSWKPSPPTPRILKPCTEFLLTCLTM